MNTVAKSATASIVAVGAVVTALIARTSTPNGAEHCGATIMLDDGSGPRALADGESVSGCPPRFTLSGRVYRLAHEDAAARQLIYRAVGVVPRVLSVDAGQ